MLNTMLNVRVFVMYLLEITAARGKKKSLFSRVGADRSWAEMFLHESVCRFFLFVFCCFLIAGGQTSVCVCVNTCCVYIYKNCCSWSTEKNRTSHNYFILPQREWARKTEKNRRVKENYFFVCMNQFSLKNVSCQVGILTLFLIFQE